MKICNKLFGILVILLASSGMAFADDIPSEMIFSLTMKHDYQAKTINLAQYPQLYVKEDSYYMNGTKISLPNKSYCDLNGEETVDVPENVEIKEEWKVSLPEIEKFLAEEVAPDWNHPSQDVRIYRDENGKIAFDGVGVFGETIDVEASARIIEKAIYEGLGFITLAVDRTYPKITVDDEELKNQGINDLLAIGESDFSGSPVNRIHNINVGADTFNGILIQKDEIFSFNSNLGEVSGNTGYRKELVIKGDRTIPDFGGGLCQVSSTTYRAAMLAGLEIVERWPHAYAVTYYTPWGSDATIYLGGKDLKFKNDTQGAILIQTRIEGNLLFFHFYGTRDNRNVALYGPYTGGWSPAPGKRTEYTTDLAPGQVQVLSGSHAGFNATWYRLVINNGMENLKTFFSPFEPRGYYYLVGVEKVPQNDPVARGPI